MIYPIIAGILIIFFIGYLGVLLSKKDYRKVKAILYPGLFFIVIWAILYFFLFK